MSVDDVLKEAGVARMTLYKNFKSKEQLIVAALRTKTTISQWLTASVEAGSCGPRIASSSCFRPSTAAWG